jgi:asparagine synthase (glutamine-hydrolysing)
MLSGQNGDLLVGSWIFDNITLLREGKFATLREELSAQHEVYGLSFWDLIRRTLYRPIRAQIWPKDTLPYVREPLRRLWRKLYPATPTSSVPSWMSDDLQDRIELPPAQREIPEDLRGYARQRRYEAINTPLQRRIGSWSERLFARHQISYADPWADRRLIEYVMAIPQHHIFRRGQNKYVAREAMRGLMPDQAWTNLQKVSPTPLYERSLKDTPKDDVYGWVDAYLHQSGEYVNSDLLVAHYENRLEGRTEEDFRFWLALCLNMWVHHHDP